MGIIGYIGGATTSGPFRSLRHATKAGLHPRRAVVAITTVRVRLFLSDNGLSGRYCLAQKVWQPTKHMSNRRWSVSSMRSVSSDEDGQVGLSTPLDPAIVSAAGRTDFSGTWVRDNGASEGLLPYLIAHGHTAAKAGQNAERVYQQTWKQAGEDPLVWTVATEATNHTSGAVEISRVIEYVMGAWDEPFKGGSSLFGESPGVVRRQTSWESQIESNTGVALVTMSETPLGREETRRWLEVRFLFSRLRPATVTGVLYSF
jgi:hypothetical protein